jgi:hypothetical protein
MLNRMRSPLLVLQPMGARKGTCIAVVRMIQHMQRGTHAADQYSKLVVVVCASCSTQADGLGGVQLELGCRALCGYVYAGQGAANCVCLQIARLGLFPRAVLLLRLSERGVVHSVVKSVCCLQQQADRVRLSLQVWHACVSCRIVDSL